MGQSPINYWEWYTEFPFLELFVKKGEDNQPGDMDGKEIGLDFIVVYIYNVVQMDNI